jgi:hypothetical protein
MFSKKCKLHLEEVGETNIQHLKSALFVALKLQLLVPILIIHGIVPRFFTKTATSVLKGILDDRRK